MAQDVAAEISRLYAEATQKGGESTVLVDGRHGYPSSGTVRDARHVLTAAHTLRRDGAIRVVGPKGEETDAELVGRDVAHDLALLRAPKDVFKAIVAAESVPAVGSPVLALARPTRESLQASLGVVGIAPGRYRGWGGTMDGVIRSDAARFAGFAGGPLVDLSGRIVGVNVLGEERGGSLTLPVEKALSIATRLETGGSIRMGYLGVRSQTAALPQPTAEGRRSGLLVVSVERDSPADRGGLWVGDILLTFGGGPLETHRDLIAALAGDVVGQEVPVQVLRGGEPRTLHVSPVETPRHE